MAPATTPPPIRVPLYKKWWFWTIAGGLFTGTIIVTYAVTRPPPAPYYGNAFPGIFPLP